VRLAETIGDRVAGGFAHDGATHEMDGWHRSLVRPYLLGAGCLGDFDALVEIGIEQRHSLVIETVRDLAKRHAELVLVAGKLNAIVDHRHFFGERVEPRITARRAFHERCELGAE
jgi:hypothetical protein